LQNPHPEICFAFFRELLAYSMLWLSKKKVQIKGKQVLVDPTHFTEVNLSQIIIPNCPIS
jgi:hypothetical protein